MKTFLICLLMLVSWFGGWFVVTWATHGTWIASTPVGCAALALTYLYAYFKLIGYLDDRGHL